MSSFEINDNSDIYYQGNYWNNLDPVVRMVNTKILGQSSGRWFDRFAQRRNRTFDRALILNCGNGWVERELVQEGLVAEAIGIDYSDTLLDEARKAAAELGLPLSYVQMNINTTPLPHDEFDLVVNYAAAHHIASIDHVFRQISRLLPEDGWFISYDYVGPHRNQYTIDAWEATWQLNKELPEHVRQRLSYPHLPTMLYEDPTEAIHSELITETLYRYFTVEDFTEIGGAIAYPLLTHNDQLFALRDDEERAKWVERVLAVDEDFLSEHPGSTLFAYFTAQPDKKVLRDTEQLARWEADENEREQRASESGGEYYHRGALQTANIALEAERQESARLRRQGEELQNELSALRNDFVFSRVRRVIDSAPIRRARSVDVVSRLERKLRPQR